MLWSDGERGMTHPPPFKHEVLELSWMEMGSEYWGVPEESMTRMVLSQRQLSANSTRSI